jgi:hypothetical protein
MGWNRVCEPQKPEPTDQTSPALQEKNQVLKNCFLASALNDEMEWTLLAGLKGSSQAPKKKTILGDLKFFFGTALVKLSDKPGFAKKTMFQGSKKFFFACLLLILPPPPRYLALARSKLRSCIQYITKNALKNWGSRLWWPIYGWFIVVLVYQRVYRKIKKMKITFNKHNCTRKYAEWAVKNTSILSHTIPLYWLVNPYMDMGQNPWWTPFHSWFRC